MRDDPFLTSAQAAEQLACSDESIRRAIKRGDLTAVTYGRLVRIRQSELDRFITAHSTRSTPAARRRSPRGIPA
jgi:excisionase family DNA binding protein